MRNDADMLCGCAQLACMCAQLACRRALRTFRRAASSGSKLIGRIFKIQLLSFLATLCSYGWNLNLKQAPLGNFASDGR